MSRVNIRFSVGLDGQATVIDTKNKNFYEVCLKRGDRFEDIYIDSVSVPDKPGLYIGVLEEIDGGYLLTSYNKLDSEKKKLVKLIGAYIKQQGGEIKLDKSYLKEISPKFRLEMQTNEKDNTRIIKLKEGK